MGEYVYWNILEKILKSERKGKKVILAGGTFDILHSGHKYFLEKAKEYGDILIVNIVNDKRAQINKRRPIRNQLKRAEVVSALESVDYSTIHHSYKKSPIKELSLLIKPEVIVEVEGKRSEDEIEEWKNLLGYEVEYKSVKRIGNESSTYYIQKIQKRVRDRFRYKKDRIHRKKALNKKIRLMYPHYSNTKNCQ